MGIGTITTITLIATREMKAMEIGMIMAGRNMTGMVTEMIATVVTGTEMIATAVTGMEMTGETTGVMVIINAEPAHQSASRLY